MSQLNVTRTIAIGLVSSLGFAAYAASTSDTIQTPFAPVQEYFELNNGFEAPAELVTDRQRSLAGKKTKKKIKKKHKVKNDPAAATHAGAGERCGRTIRCTNGFICKNGKCSRP